MWSSKCFYLRKADLPGVGVGSVDLLGPMGAAVDLQDVVVEVLDAQAQPGDPKIADRPELVIGEGSWLALERDLLGLVPGEQPLHAVGEKPELIGRQVARGAATEIEEPGFPTPDPGLLGEDLEFLEEGIQVSLDLVGVLVGVDPEVAEMAALPAEGDVGVQAEPGGVRARVLVEHGLESLEGIGFPEGEGRVVGDEVVPGGGLLLERRSCGRGWGRGRAGTHGDVGGLEPRQ